MMNRNILTYIYFLPLEINASRQSETIFFEKKTTHIGTKKTEFFMPFYDWILLLSMFYIYYEEMKKKWRVQRPPSFPFALSVACNSADALWCLSGTFSAHARSISIFSSRLSQTAVVHPCSSVRRWWPSKFLLQKLKLQDSWTSKKKKKKKTFTTFCGSLNNTRGL